MFISEKHTSMSHHITTLTAYSQGNENILKPLTSTIETKFHPNVLVLTPFAMQENTFYS
jgi:hypothetical protein